MPAPPNRVIGAIGKINSCSWLIGGKLVLSHQSSPSPDHPSWSDGKGAVFVLSVAPDPAPESQPLPEDTPDFQPEAFVYSAGSSAAICRARDAFIKVRFLGSDRANTTRKPTTLAFLQAKTAQQPLGFSIPRVLYHAEWDNRSYLVLTRVPGQTLAEAWPSLDDTQRQHYVDRIAAICSQLASWKSDDTISGVDGRELEDAMLAKNDNPQSFAPHRLLAHCAKMGMEINNLSCKQSVF